MNVHLNLCLVFLLTFRCMTRIYYTFRKSNNLKLDKSMPWIRNQIRACSNFNNITKQLNYITFTAFLQQTSHCKAQSRSNLTDNREKILFCLKYIFLNPAFFCFRKPLKSYLFHLHSMRASSFYQ